MNGVAEGRMPTTPGFVYNAFPPGNVGNLILGTTLLKAFHASSIIRVSLCLTALDASRNVDAFCSRPRAKF